jgi:hypothetical protein
MPSGALSEFVVDGPGRRRCGLVVVVTASESEIWPSESARLSGQTACNPDDADGQR